MICPKCSSENRPGAKFCDECGAALCDANVDTSAEQALPSESAAQTVVLPAIEPSGTCNQEQSGNTAEEGFDYSDPTFSFDELLARVRVLVRKNSSHSTSQITVGDLTVDLASRRVSRVGNVGSASLYTQNWKV